VISYAWLVPLSPLVGALIAAAAGRKLKDRAHIPVIGGIALAFLFSLRLLGGSGSPGESVTYEWLAATDLHIPVMFRVDGLTTMMLTMVTFVSTLIAVYSVGYMAGDPGYPRFFSLIGLFVFSMTGLVLSSNYVLTYAFWEGVGACSYLLVGFWYAKPAAAAAAKKAFLVNRVGDFGFALALLWMWKVMPGHSLNYDNVLNIDTLGLLSPTTKLGLALLLFWAATAKSAQIPLYVWLPDAMEGPTPVSALIHAATMVTAGVYVIARSSLLIGQSPSVQVLIATIGCLTALLSAAIALTQTDLKRVLAYSTISQLGYMFMGLGAGIGNVATLAVVAAMFHLFTHAFFKALLFLAAGSVMHSMGGVVDMRRFRGLRHRMPTTCWTFAVGGLALSGIFPLAGFWSKDEILAALGAAEHLSSRQGNSSWAAIYFSVYWVAVITVFMTAFYTGRAFFLTFFGPEKLPSPDDPEAPPTHADLAHASRIDTDGSLEDAQGVAAAAQHDAHATGHEEHFGHESPSVMTVPLIILAVCAALVGLIFGPTGWFAAHLERTPSLFYPTTTEPAHGYDWMTAVVGTLFGVAGLASSWWMYASPSDVPARLAGRFPRLYRTSFLKFGVDTFYDTVVIRPTRALAAFCNFLDEHLVDNVLVRGSAWLPRYIGREWLAPFQNGFIQFYAAVTALGVAVLLVILLLI
jgi:NADH-quinone oxidoreductase subunit L